jgi:hypothetical protein
MRAGDAAHQPSGAHQSVPPLAPLGVVETVGQAPELLDQDHAENIDIDIERDARGRAGLA